ncbi:hypothetical protein [Clostridium hydrogenum]|uniref:hypothetical protein n=1 Tax=Clostridium hydrogenum TaxID=2855764 RepID=UPI001F23A36B|nr:hypothetical protein [Clostridium hydrogenum]
MEDNIDYYKVSDISPFCNSPKKLIFEILEVIMNFLIFYPVISYILYPTSKNGVSFLLTSILTIIYLAAINLIRIKLKRKKLIFFLSLVLGLSFFTIPLQESSKWVIGIYLTLELLKSLRKTFKPNYKFYSLPFFFFGELVLGINLVFAYTINSSYVIFLNILSSIIFALLFLFYLSSSRSAVLINAEKGYTFNNIKKLTAGSRKILLPLLFIFLAVISFILLLTNGINHLINSNIVKQIVSLFVSANPYNTTTKQFDMQRNSLYKMFHPNGSDISIKSTNNFSSSHTSLILIILVTIILFFFLYLLFKRLLDLKAKMVTQTNTDTETVFLEEDLKKDLISIRHKFNFNLSNKEKLRRKYKKLIKSYAKKGLKIQDSSTTNELENEISELTKDNIKNCGDIYRKARYSSFEPTPDDISKIK